MNNVSLADFQQWFENKLFLTLNFELCAIYDDIDKINFKSNQLSANNDVLK